MTRDLFASSARDDGVDVTRWRELQPLAERLVRDAIRELASGLQINSVTLTLTPYVAVLAVTPVHGDRVTHHALLSALDRLGEPELVPLARQAVRELDRRRRSP